MVSFASLSDDCRYGLNKSTVGVFIYRYAIYGSTGLHSVSAVDLIILSLIEAYHALRAIRVKFTVVKRFQLFSFGLRDAVLDCILEIGRESPIGHLHKESLVIDHRPSTPGVQKLCTAR